MSGFSFLKSPAERKNDAIETLNKIFEEQENKIKRIEQEKKTLADECWRDNTIASLQQQLKVYQDRSTHTTTFNLTEDETDAVNEWKERHKKNAHGYDSSRDSYTFGGAIGGNFEYHFCPTSIGTVATCVCGICFHKALIEAEGDKQKFYNKMKEYDGEYTIRDL